LWKTFAQQNHKKSTYNLSSAQSARCCSALLQNYGFSFALRKAKKAFSSKAPNQLSEAAKKKRQYHNG
jgi:hypothetical protein